MIGADRHPTSPVLALVAASLAAAVAAHVGFVAEHVHGLPSPTLLLLGALLAVVLTRTDRVELLPPPRVVVPLGAVVLVAAASAAWAVEPEVAIAAASTLGRDVLLALLLAGVVGRLRIHRLVLWATMLAIATVAAATVHQHLTGAYGATYAGFAVAQLGNITEGTDSWRLTGPFGDANYFGQSLTVGAAIALNRAWFERSVVSRLVAGGCLAACVLALLPTYSRGGILALVVVAAAFLVLRRPRGLALLAAAAVLVGATSALPADLRERLVAAQDVSVGTAGTAPADIAVRGRLSEILAGVDMFVERPLLGVGAQNYPVLYQEYAQQRRLDPRRGPRAPHSLYVEIAAETGALGLAAFTGLLVVTAGALRRGGLGWSRRRPTSAPPSTGADRGVAEGFGLALLAFLTTSIVLHAAHARLLWVLFAVALTLPAAAPAHRPDRGVRPAADEPHLVSRGAAPNGRSVGPEGR